MTLPAKAFAVALGAACLLSAPAVAQTAPGPAAGQPDSMGPPRARAEIPAWADRLFDHLDANQDAAVTGDELAALSRVRRRPWAADACAG